MKNKWILLLIAVFAASALMMKAGSYQGRQLNAKAAREGQQVPMFHLATLDDKIISAQDYRGRAVILNFWATWCASCVAEMPSFQRFYEANKSNQSLAVITVLYKDGTDEALKFMKKNKYDLPVFIDDKSANARAFGLTGVPETFFIDKSGVLFKKVLGPIEWESPAIKDLINELISKG
ncbi:MAG: redoxin domain-containing protein [Candidatus Magnetominusculus sp. LBB02]|nr:redoxin domain-containing protein [Candidatus Magnetominusculus sp. LBB02]